MLGVRVEIETMLAQLIPMLRPGALFLAGFTLTAVLVYGSTEQPLGLPTWNLHHGLAFGCLLRFGLRFAPFVVAAMMAEYCLIGAGATTWSVSATAGTATALTYASACGIYVRTRIFRQEFWELRDVSWFLLAAGVASLVEAAAVQVVTGTAPASPIEHLDLLYSLWIADVTGLIVVAPLLLVHLARTNAYVTAEFWWSAEPLWQAAAFVTTMAVVLTAARAQEIQYFYLAFVPLIWVSMRYGVAGATLIVLAIQCTLTFGLFLIDSDVRSQLTVQWRMLALSITGLYLGVAVSERRSIRNDLLEREAELRAVLQGAPDAIFTVDRRGRILGVNQAAEQLFGVPHTMLDRERFETLFPDMAPSALGDIANREVIATRADGSRFECELSLRMVDVANRNFCIAIARDVSARKALERSVELQQLGIQRTLRQAAAGELATTIAHELNQPLSAIRGYARACELLAGKLPEEAPRLRETLSKVRAEAERAGNVVRRLREFFRSGVLTREAVDMAALVDQVARATREAAQAHGIELEYTPIDGLPPVAVDRLQIETVLHNLVANGIESIAEQGSERRRIRLAVERAGHGIRITVEDSGPGVATDMLPRLFEPFVTSKRAGMGLGLAICRTLIEAHGGDIAIGRATLGGACVQVSLPGDTPAGPATEVIASHGAQEKHRAPAT